MRAYALNVGEESDSLNGAKWSRVILVLVLVFTAICLLPVVSCLRMPEPEELVKRFQIGSRITDLDRQLGTWSPASFDVGEAESDSQGSQGHRMVKTMIGTFRQDFSGGITLYHHSWVIPDDIRPSFTMDLIYEKGVLTDVDYGILPG